MCLDDYWSDSNTYTTAWCGTAADTAAKAASCTNYTATANTYIPVLMRYANSYNGAITLNINSQGAKPIYINGTASSSSNKTLPAGTYIVFYNGTNYYFRTDGTIEGIAKNTLASVNSNGLLSAAGFIKLNSSITDVQINGTSIKNNDEVNIVTNSVYNATTNKIATMADVGSGGSGLPIGSGMDYFGTTLPSNEYMWADGSEISRTDYAELFAIIGTTYGAGNGQTTFNLPDKRERVSVMYKAQSTKGTSGASFGTMGAKGGEDNHQLTVTEMPKTKFRIPHVFAYDSCLVSGGGYTQTRSGQQYEGNANVVSNDGWHVLATGGDTAHNNLQPYLICNYIIKVK